MAFVNLDGFKQCKYGVITGQAGCGKTHTIQQIVKDDPSWGLLTATTGVAARNLGGNVPTVHSALGFFDLASLRRLHANGDLAWNMQDLAKRRERVIIDEVSMLTREALEILTAASTETDLGIILSGDFLQLPPVVVDHEETPKPWWAFEAAAWDIYYAPNTWMLTKSYRQSHPVFLDGLRKLRGGNGSGALDLFKRCNVNFTDRLDYKFPGTSIVATNRLREEFNARMYSSLSSKEITYKSTRWGNQRREWRDIPEEVSLKVGAHVMILRNEYEKKGVLLYANGDCGEVLAIDNDSVWVRRDTDFKELVVNKTSVDDSEILCSRIIAGQRVVEKTEPTGGVTYMPLVQAWAITVHKSQGLTLDSVQVNLPENFYGKPAMVYVACSRCRNPEGLVLVGGERFLPRRCASDKDAKRWTIDAINASKTA